MQIRWRLLQVATALRLSCKAYRARACPDAVSRALFTFLPGHVEDPAGTHFSLAEAGLACFILQVSVQPTSALGGLP